MKKLILFAVLAGTLLGICTTFRTTKIPNLVQDGSVRVMVGKFGIPVGSGSGTIIKATEHTAIVLTVKHVTLPIGEYTIDYTHMIDGEIIDMVSFPAELLATDPFQDLALIKFSYMDEDLDETKIKCKVYNGDPHNLHNIDIYISSHPLGIGPVLGRGYINISRVFVDGTNFISGNTIVDYGSSGASMRLANTGEIVAIASNLVGPANKNIVGQINGVSFQHINEFLDDNGIKLE